jgi:hypothetical protein
LDTSVKSYTEAPHSLRNAFLVGHNDLAQVFRVHARPPVFNIACGGFGIGLFDEPFDREKSGSNGWSGTDVTVFGRRARRVHAEHDDLIFLCRFACHPANFGKGAGIGDDVVGGKRGDERIATAP